MKTQDNHICKNLQNLSISAKEHSILHKLAKVHAFCTCKSLLNLAELYLMLATPPPPPPSCSDRPSLLSIFTLKVFRLFIITVSQFPSSPPCLPQMLHYLGMPTNLWWKTKSVTQLFQVQRTIGNLPYLIWVVPTYSSILICSPRLIEATMKWQNICITDPVVSECFLRCLHKADRRRHHWP